MLLPKDIVRFLVSHAAALVAGGVLCLCGLIAYIVFNAYPYSMDEYNYLYQAQIFAQGQRSIPIEFWQRQLKEQYMLVYNGGIFSKYPPGFSALLAVGLMLGVAPLVNPILSALTAYMLFKALRVLLSVSAAFWATVILVFNSYFLGYGASYYAQPACLFLFSVAFYGLVRFVQHGANRFLGLAGAAIGVCVLVRPVDAAAILAGITVVVVFQRRVQGVQLAGRYLAIPTALGLLALCLYNWLLTGCFCLANYSIIDMEFQLVMPESTGFLDNITRLIDSYLQSLRNNAAPLLTEHFIPYIGIWLLLLAGLGWIVSPAWVKIFAMVTISAFVGLYNFHFTQGWPQYGARYWYPALVAIGLLIGWGSEWLARRSRHGFYLFLCVLMVNQISRITSDISTYHTRFLAKETIQRDIEQACPPGSIVYLHEVRIKIPAEQQRQLGRFFRLWDYKRNPFLNGERLYVVKPLPKSVLPFYHPTYSVCDYTYPSPRVIEKLAKL